MNLRDKDCNISVKITIDTVLKSAFWPILLAFFHVNKASL